MQKQTWDDFGDILIALEETWPAVARHTMDPWIIRDGQGGGKRVSAATPNSYWTQADIQAAIADVVRLERAAFQREDLQRHCSRPGWHCSSSAPCAKPIGRPCEDLVCG